jgi:hypothetical protein
MKTLIVLVAAILVCLAIARINHSTSLFWKLLVAILLGIAIGAACLGDKTAVAQITQDNNSIHYDLVQALPITSNSITKLEDEVELVLTKKSHNESNSITTDSFIGVTTVANTEDGVRGSPELKDTS